jgi:type IV secretory pathway VirB4 component
MLNLKEYRTYSHGVHHLLALSCSVGSGIMLTKDQALLGAFELVGHDLANMTPTDRNRLSARFSDVLNHFFKAGFVTQFELIRKKCPGYPARELSHFTDAFSALMDDEKRADFEKEGNHYESVIILVVRYKSPTLHKPWFKNLFYTGKKEEVLTSLEHDIQYFERHLQSFSQTLTGTLSLRRMREYNHPDSFGQTVLRDDLLNYLNFTLTCEHYPVNKPTDKVFQAEDYLGVRDFFPGDILKIGSQYVVVLTLSVAARSTYPNMLEILNHLPIEYRWVTRMIHLDPHEALGIVKKVMKAWQQQEKNGAKQMLRIKTPDTENLNALEMRMNAQSVSADIHSGQLGYGYCTQNVVLYSTNRAEVIEHAKLVIRELSRQGHSCFMEELNAVEAWLGTLPGNVHHNVRRQLTHTEHLANMVPLTSVWTGRDYCPNPLMQEATA